MARLTANALLPVLAVAVLGAGGYAAFLHLTADRPAYVVAEPRDDLPQAPDSPDVDSPADTIRRLLAEQTAANETAQRLVEQNERLAEDNASLAAEVRRIREEVEQRVALQVKNTLARHEHSRTRDVSALAADVRSLRDDLARRARDAVSAPDRDRPGQAVALDPAATGAAVRLDWIEPLDQDRIVPAAATPAAAAVAPVAAAGRPVFTINTLAALLQSTTWTALIGRIPRQGQVQDPVPFKVLVGRDNLAASGLTVPPEVFGMVFGGTAVGDYTLSCVYGHLHTATFIFQDGTIHTLDRRQGGGGGAGAGGGSGGEDRLGYLTDAFGIPCISGTRISSASDAIALRVAARGLTAAAEGFAAAQTTTVAGGATGTLTTGVTGDAARFALGRMAGEATRSIDDLVSERLSDTFDAVFVPAGQPVGIQIEQPITIDHLPEARKLSHGIAFPGMPGSSPDGLP